MSKLFGIPVSLGNKSKYRAVPQALSDEDWSDDEIDEFTQTQLNHGDLELKLLPKIDVDVDGKKKKKKKEVEIRGRSKGKYFCFCVVVVCVCVIGLVGILLSRILFKPTPVKGENKILINNKGSSHQQIFNQTENWKRSFEGHGSESCIRLVDLDGDGRLDILVGIVDEKTMNEMSDVKESNSFDGVKAFCDKNNLEYPCAGQLIALRGYDGQEMWRVRTRSAVIFMNCEDFDVNQDGINDCIVSGRQSTIQAVERRTGKTLWTAGDILGHFKVTWNVYQAVALPDFDNDGVPEILLCHGGEPGIPPEVHNRSSARLIMLSGATGDVIGRYLAMPDDKESYMTPVMYTGYDGAQFILFGSGGETVPGDLMAISVANFYRYVKHLTSDDQVPGIVENYPLWSGKSRMFGTNILRIYRGVHKGVMVPPLIIDVDKDGVDDILMSAYDGRLILYNGTNMGIVWATEYIDFESYSTPAPGYFDDDDTIDFMFQMSKGAWPQYNYTKTLVISGTDGKILWVTSSGNYQMSSDLVLRTKEPHRDVFLFKLRAQTVLGSMPNQDQIVKRHAEHQPSDPGGNLEHRWTEEELEEAKEHYKLHHLTCEENLEPYIQDILLIDRYSMKNPIKILGDLPIKHNYTFKLLQMTEGVEICIVMDIDARSTGAVGDLDGDGTLDYVDINFYTGELINEHYGYTGNIFNTYIRKVNLETQLQSASRIQLVDVKSQFSPNQTSTHPPLENLEFLDMKQQSWTQYLGMHINSHYEENQH